jgi:hypothetical protein
VGDGLAVVGEAVAVGEVVMVGVGLIVEVAVDVVAPGTPTGEGAGLGTVMIIVASTSGATGVPSGSTSSTEKVWALGMTLFQTAEVWVVDWKVPAAVVA